jgi:hypothetical protein
VLASGEVEEGEDEGEEVLASGTWKPIAPRPVLRSDPLPQEFPLPEASRVSGQFSWSPRHLEEPLESSYQAEIRDWGPTIPRLRSSLALVPAGYASDERIPRARMAPPRIPATRAVYPAGYVRHNPLSGPLVSATLEASIDDRQLRGLVHFYGYPPTGVGYSPPGANTAMTEASVVWALENFNLGLERVREELPRE